MHKTFRTWREEILHCLASLIFDLANLQPFQIVYDTSSKETWENKKLKKNKENKI